MTNKECKVRPEIVNVNSNEPVFYPFSIKASKCSGSCNSINDPYAKICVPDDVKDLNVKVFNLVSKTNETRHITMGLIKVYAIKDILGILVTANVNAINHVMLVSI